MTKQELIAHFQEQKKIIEREIVFWQAQPDAEAEKPKLGHGDFGTNKEGDLRLVIAKTNGVLTLAGCVKLGCCVETVDEIRKEGFILGNIFDLLKEQSVDLTFFAFDVHHCEINTVDFPHAPIHFAGNWHTLSEIEEIHHKLGRVIATLKRKQSLT
ncbi:hypothetical protein LCGC14_2757590 [marine sediment metagenome]|uniref:Uncharacterized protein n=1 Tax=marine sediment metagenome TaxID=412755 RepID=A0A0F8ZLV1_9ZZZZ